MSEMTAKPKGRVDEARAEITRGGPHFVPHVDILESDSDLWLYADMPGVRADDVEMNYEKGELMLSARIAPRSASPELMLREYEAGDFRRVFTVHESIDASRIEATCKNGVLLVKLAKHESARPRKITVKSE
jgi:HSP20 family protein